MAQNDPTLMQYIYEDEFEAQNDAAENMKKVQDDFKVQMIDSGYNAMINKAMKKNMGKIRFRKLPL